MSPLIAIEAVGADAASFLHNQLSNDINALAIGDSCAAHYCSVKGRTLAFFVIKRLEEERFVLICHADQHEPLLKRLRMFVLRSKVTLTVIDWEHLEEQIFTNAQFSINSQTLAGEGAIEAAVSCALPFLPAASQEQHIPQSLNGDLDGSVNFKKGCYPGQEIVARTHYLGKPKRRMHRVSTSKPLDAGATVDANDKSVGEVILAADNQALITLHIDAVSLPLSVSGQPIEIINTENTQ